MKNTTNSNSRNINASLVEKAISLTQNSGYRHKDKNLSGYVLAYDKDDIGIVYTTPFSGAEIYPGLKSYILDIWYKHKKVYSIYYMCTDELLTCKKRPSGEWLDKLMKLKTS